MRDTSSDLVPETWPDTWGRVEPSLSGHGSALAEHRVIRQTDDLAELLGTAAEVDLDTIMVLDGLVCGPITRFLMRLVGCDPSRVVSVTRSASRGGRETDIRLETDDGVLLVENKIDARFQPDQQRSYALEVARFRASGTPAWAVVVFPARRKPEMEQTAGEHFDALVPIQDLIDKIEWPADTLSSASLAVLRRTLQPKLAAEVDPVRSAWGEGYRLLVAELAGESGLVIGERALRTATSSFVQFLSAGVSERGWVSHHIQEGEVEAGLYRRRPEPETVPSIARPRTKSSVRASVPVMNFDRPASEQREALAAALQAVLELRNWILSHDIVA